jgi:hypothetical protein
VKERVKHNDGKASAYLVVRPRNIDRTLLGKTLSLGRYATHEFAAKAAAVYFAKHQARKKHSASRPVSSAAGMLSKK